MKYIMPEASSDSPQLRLIEAPEDSPLDDIRVELETEREYLEEQAKVEEYWAGRNLAGRNSTRQAA
jgi:hypothetical protein